MSGCKLSLKPYKDVHFSVINEILVADKLLNSKKNLIYFAIDHAAWTPPDVHLGPTFGLQVEKYTIWVGKNLFNEGELLFFQHANSDFPSWCGETEHALVINWIPYGSDSGPPMHPHLYLWTTFIFILI
jgi:hypothetical protein